MEEHKTIVSVCRIYLIVDAFDARPAASFTFDVFFGLWRVARTAADGFRQLLSVSTEA